MHLVGEAAHPFFGVRLDEPPEFVDRLAFGLVRRDEGALLKLGLGVAIDLAVCVAGLFARERLAADHASDQAPEGAHRVGVEGRGHAGAPCRWVSCRRG
jgi:hypothetical protein